MHVGWFVLFLRSKVYNRGDLSFAESLQLDHDACGNINSMIVPCCGDLRELKGGHYHKIVEITENAGKCLLDEYVVRQTQPPIFLFLFYLM